MSERKPFYIGNGEYNVFYKEPFREKVVRFVGLCENFNTAGLSAFWNQEKEQMLLINYKDIVALCPIESTENTV